MSGGWWVTKAEVKIIFKIPEDGRRRRRNHLSAAWFFVSAAIKLLENLCWFPVSPSRLVECLGMNGIDVQEAANEWKNFKKYRHSTHSFGCVILELRWAQIILIFFQLLDCCLLYLLHAVHHRSSGWWTSNELLLLSIRLVKPPSSCVKFIKL